MAPLFYTIFMARQWIIPDVHGYLETLKSLVDYQIRPSSSDTLYFLGDYIDRGPDSKGVLDYLMSLRDRGIKARFLKGNHEEYFADAWRADQNLGTFLGIRKANPLAKDWYRYGGKETIRSFGVRHIKDIEKKYVDWIDQLEYYIVLDKFVLVHAGLNFQIEDVFDDKQAMLWAKDFQCDLSKIGGRRVIHGHTPVSHEFIFDMVESSRFEFIDLDNGVYYKGQKGFGNLTALEINEMILLAQPSLDG
ncbi:MAG: metallophosphoesterase family protein [Bacteroidales bacterium]|nr:metallophosphoesterase family protein [Bacteroidales bacterium]